MKKIFVIAVWFLLMLVCLTSQSTASPLREPAVRLPTEYVTLVAEADASSMFDMTLSNVSSGFDVVNGHYLGWCVEKNVTISLGVNHPVKLYSSYDPDMPSEFRSDNWDKVNYIINHKQGDKQVQQQVIWYYICNVTSPLSPKARSLINDTEAHGEGFVPSPGQTIVILLHGYTKIQRTILELSLPHNVSIGDLVWNDRNVNGIQDVGEPGMPNVTVQLYSESNDVVASSVTDTHGYYSFSNFTLGIYSIQFTLQPGYKFSPQHQGADDTKDSDANSVTGRTGIAAFDPSNIDMSWDTGMYVPGHPPSGGPNHVPTADGTAGEPYKGFIGDAIKFNGKRSYDIDGTITSYNWSFSDGTFAEGSMVTHVYNSSGIFFVSFTVTDDDGATDTYNTHATIRGTNWPPSPPQMSGPTEGHQNTTYTFYIVTTDPDNDTVRYTIDWGDGAQNISTSHQSNHMMRITHAWSAIGFYLLTMTATDLYNATSSPYHVLISIDARYVGDLGYLMNTDGAGSFDLFYCNQTGNTTAVQVQSNGDYLIDSNGDGSFDTLYNSQSGSVQPYSNTLGPVYTMLLVGVVIVIVFVVLVSFLMKRKSKP